MISKAGSTIISRICETCKESFDLEIGEAKRTGWRYRRFCSLRCSKMEANNPQWKGNDAGAVSGRTRAQHKYLNIGPCQRCGSTKSVERHHINGDTLNNQPDNVEFVCRRCHMKVDGRLDKLIATGKVVRRKGREAAALIKRQMTHCGNGHEFSPENTKMTASGSRQCRTCLKANSYRYWDTHRSLVIARNGARRKKRNAERGNDAARGESGSLFAVQPEE